ncbi:acetate/propionate family kinase [Roseateles sp. PN1]|uniref:acetate/propionate family kinase n=1 Tax=Roseateles sp. PN1 TaxID=3137372 RepID=UPI0031391607
MSAPNLPEQAIVVLNAGSSSVKFSVFIAQASGALSLRLHGQVEALFNQPHFLVRGADGALMDQRHWSAGTQLGHHGALEYLIEFLRQHSEGIVLLGVGHRVVHGGMSYADPVRVDAATLAALAQFVPLAPLHQPHNLDAIRAVAELLPEVPQVACFDTAFHRSDPDMAQMFALPQRFFEEGVRRYGFHGLSYEYIASVLPALAPRAASGRTVVMHLGNGASMCALSAGRSVASTMGFTAIDGLPMGTRSGNLDPGVVLYLQQERGMSAAEVERLLYQQSGLLGMSGLSSDMRTLLASDSPAARRAVDHFVYRCGRELGSLAAALGGLDAVVFTAGVGENSAEIRARICRQAAWLGLQLDEAANAAGGPCISLAGSVVEAWTLPTDEELMIARHTQRVLMTQ